MEIRKREPQRRELAVEEQGQALEFLLANVKGKSRNAVKSLLTNRQVLVDGQVVTRHDTPLAPGQVVTILPPGAPAASGGDFLGGLPHHGISDIGGGAERALPAGEPGLYLGA